MAAGDRRKRGRRESGHTSACIHAHTCTQTEDQQTARPVCAPACPWKQRAARSHARTCRPRRATLVHTAPQNLHPHSHPCGQATRRSVQRGARRPAGSSGGDARCSTAPRGAFEFRRGGARQRGRRAQADLVDALAEVLARLAAVCRHTPSWAAKRGGGKAPAAVLVLLRSAAQGTCSWGCFFKKKKATPKRFLFAKPHDLRRACSGARGPRPGNRFRGGTGLQSGKRN